MIDRVENFLSPKLRLWAKSELKINVSSSPSHTWGSKSIVKLMIDRAKNFLSPKLLLL
ncbi:hypothetical protein [Fowl aviadenovirus 4]|nr:hypothetical protein [Fowl aviadenovirus 4]ULR92078.1 hypothetical protein [Fowl aviadenovirus 4]ULR92118.1 hypothetical protein [Fowl aviadenovirus 4]ULR92157.1 hypothetical protein [Fowl aviadenovirus 4]ULR92195.1 hypothetical protein [Fowl aviadenovirus 4]